MIKPLFNYVLLERELKEEKTKSGILLTTKEEKKEYAKVVALSDGVMPDGKHVDFPFKVGDYVFTKEYGHETIKEDGKEYLLVPVENIIAVIK